MRVSLYNVNVVPADATGNTLLAKLAALRAAGVPTRVFTHASDVVDESIDVVTEIDQVRRNAFFRKTDVHVFEFGWTYKLFDLLREIKPPARTIVSFHGITPRALMPPHAVAGIEQTTTQLSNARVADIVLAASRYGRDFLVEHGINPGRVRLLPLPIRLPHVRRQPTNPARTALLFVGRLVPSKGALDLLQSLAILRDEGLVRWGLSIVTNPAAAHPDYMARVQDFIRDAGLAPWIDHFGVIEDRERLANLYAGADAVVVPTYSETYCLPLLEALANGCAVIAYASGAVPEISRGLARLLPTGDAQALKREIARLLSSPGASTVAISDDLSIPRTEFERLAHERTRDLTGETYDLAFLELIREPAAAAGRRSTFVA